MILLLCVKKIYSLTLEKYDVVLNLISDMCNFQYQSVSVSKV